MYGHFEAGLLHIFLRLKNRGIMTTPAFCLTKCQKYGILKLDLKGKRRTKVLMKNHPNQMVQKSNNQERDKAKAESLNRQGSDGCWWKEKLESEARNDS